MGTNKIRERSRHYTVQTVDKNISNDTDNSIDRTKCIELFDPKVSENIINECSVVFQQLTADDMEYVSSACVIMLEDSKNDYDVYKNFISFLYQLSMSANNYEKFLWHIVLNDKNDNNDTMEILETMLDVLKLIRKEEICIKVNKDDTQGNLKFVTSILDKEGYFSSLLNENLGKVANQDVKIKLLSIKGLINNIKSLEANMHECYIGAVSHKIDTLTKLINPNNEQLDNELLEDITETIQTEVASLKEEIKKIPNEMDTNIEVEGFDDTFFETIDKMDKKINALEARVLHIHSTVDNIFETMQKYIGEEKRFMEQYANQNNQQQVQQNIVPQQDEKNDFF